MEFSLFGYCSQLNEQEQDSKEGAKEAGEKI